MSRFKFKEWLFSNFFPSYYKENDTYKDENGKGILERFIEVCSEYFDDNITPNIDNLLDQIDPDTAQSLFLNYIWEYFGYLPFAWGVLIGNNDEDWDFSKDQVSRWMNTLTAFPKADARKMLKYAISLYKIRGTEAFYQILGRFYGVQFTLTPVNCNECSPNPNDNTALWKATYHDNKGDWYTGFKSADGVTDIVAAHRGPVDAFDWHDPIESQSKAKRRSAPEPKAAQVIEPSYDGFILGTYGNRSSFPENGDVKAAWSTNNCWNCACYKITVGIPEGMWDLIESSENPEQRKSDITKAFTTLMNKYLPIYARICNENVTIEPERPIIEVTGPPRISPQAIESRGVVILNGTDTSMVASGIRIDPAETIIQPQESVTLTAKITPPSGVYHTINWEVLDTEVLELVSQEDGACVVKAIAESGSADVKVTITSDKGEFSATAHIVVEREGLVKATYHDEEDGKDKYTNNSDPNDEYDRTAAYRRTE